jgi:hypothetical protein
LRFANGKRGRRKNVIIEVGECQLWVSVLLSIRAEIHQALLSHVFFLADFLIGKVLGKDRDSSVLKLVNLNPKRLREHFYTWLCILLSFLLKSKYIKTGSDPCQH